MIRKKFPKLPGVYLFKDAPGNILYIGKAKSLQERLNSYFNDNDEREKIAPLLEEAVDIETIVTANEIEALYLEAHLVKEHQPKYNTLLKQGDPFIYLFIGDEKGACLEIVRTQKQKGEYFGPFLYKQQARKVYEYLMRTFQLKKCSKKMPEGCLAYHINVCAGSCKPDFDENYYATKIEVVRQLLRNNLQDAYTIIEQEVKNANKQMLFERAKHLHMYAENMEYILRTMQALQSSKITHTILNKQPTKSNVELLSKLKTRLGLRHIPYTIDCFDISHLQSQFMVGSCIRFLDGRPDKKNFRKFKIKTLQQQNDYAALQEIVKRRYKNSKNLPDLIIIDGGVGQVNATKDLVGNAELVGLAKREETIIIPNSKKEIKLDIQKEEDRLLLYIRDYAHHFAISYHRSKRSILESDSKEIV
jgi:excinuclease ABC subunit C